MLDLALVVNFDRGRWFGLSSGTVGTDEINGYEGRRIEGREISDDISWLWVCYSSGGIVILLLTGNFAFVSTMHCSVNQNFFIT